MAKIGTCYVIHKWREKQLLDFTDGLLKIVIYRLCLVACSNLNGIFCVLCFNSYLYSLVSICPCMYSNFAVSLFQGLSLSFISLSYLSVHYKC